MKCIPGIVGVLAVVSPFTWMEVSAAETASSTITLARTVAPGAALTALDLTADENDPIARMQIAGVVGLEARRLLVSGAPLRDSDLRAPTLVLRNSVVRMEYVSGPLSIVTEGRALAGGAGGDVIKVLNLTSKAVVTAEITERGKVVVR